ncbi:MAG: hypothetical protein JW966_09115 [Anaerolineae bacterium]|nr:hypothetical protein [Anaerolineae bacterium]
MMNLAHSDMQHTTGQPTSSTPSIGDLGAIFGFAPDELAFNRAGRVSARQRQALRYRGIGFLVKGAAACVLNVILAAALAPGITYPWQRTLYGVLWALIALFALAVIGGTLLVVHPVVRHVTTTIKRSPSAARPCLIAGKLELRISGAAWRRMPPSYSGQFRVYYARFAGWLLSLEPWSDMA